MTEQKNDDNRPVDPVVPTLVGELAAQQFPRSEKRRSGHESRLSSLLSCWQASFPPFLGPRFTSAFLSFSLIRLADRFGPPETSEPSPPMEGLAPANEHT